MAQEAIVEATERVVADLDATGRHLSLTYAGVCTAYHSDEVTTGAWVARFFEGYFVPTDTREADATVYSTSDPALFSSLQSLTSGRPVPAQRDYVEMPLTDAVTLVHTRATKVTPHEDVYRLLFAQQRRMVLVTSARLEVRQEEGMQALRALTKWLLLERGWVPMHSACAAKGSQAVCITGHKASGKTSTLLNLLATNGCDLLAIDKFLVRDAGAPLEVCGLPGKGGIRVGSAILHPRLLEWLGADDPSFFSHIGAREVQQIAASNTVEQLRDRKEKIHLLPTELAQVFGVSIRPRAPLGLILIPVFDLSADTARLDPVDAEQAATMLTECYAGLLGKGEGFLLHFFDLSDAGLKERLDVVLREHLREVDAYRLTQNHTTSDQAATLVAGVLA